MSDGAIPLTTCPNCGAALGDAFCPHCGQKKAPLNPSLGEFLHEAVHEMAHVDGKFLTSVRLLLLKPGTLSREQFEGRRAPYVPPIRLYLVLSVLCFAALAFAPLRGPRFSCTTCPEETRARVEQEMREAVGHWTPRAMFVLVPIFAGLVAVVARPSHRNYPQHLYFAMHVHAAWFLVGAVAALTGLALGPARGGAVATVLGVWALLYFAVAFHRAYQSSVFRAVVAAVLVPFAYLIAIAVAMLTIIMPVAARH